MMSSMAHSSSSITLLSLPSGVETILLPFVSWGEGGVESILNLRLVCKTTKSWIDNLPSSIAKRVFSQTCVKINLDQFTKESMDNLMISNSPPSGVTSLRVSVEDKDHCNSELHANTELADKFQTYWAPRLQWIDLQLMHFNKRLTNFFLNKKYTLTEINISIHGLRDFVFLRSYVKKLNPNSQVKINLTFVENKIYYENGSRIILSSPRGEKESLRKFLITLVQLKSHFHITIKDIVVLFSIRLALLAAVPVYQDFCNIVESLEMKAVSGQTDDVGEQFQSLKNLHVNGRNLELREVTFPSSLKSLRLCEGCAQNPLPESLTTFKLDNYSSSPNVLVNSMILLEHQCPNLQVLNVNWKIVEIQNDNPTTIIDRILNATGFPKMRSLTFVGEFLRKENAKEMRNAMNLILPWNELKLKLLNLRLVVTHQLDYIRVIDSKLLSSILSGPTANSLLRIEIPDETVTVSGLEALNDLKVKVADNWKKREELLGRRILPEHPDFLSDNAMIKWPHKNL